MHRKFRSMGSVGPQLAAVNTQAARIPRRQFVLTLLVAVLLASCGSDEAARKIPTSPDGGGTTTVPVSIVRLELSGPTTVALGKTVQFTAVAQQSDGTTRDVTRDAVWRVSNSSVLSVAGPGEILGKDKGETSLSISYSGRNATIGAVIVVPEGTYRLVGTIRDGGANVLQADVRIDNQALGILRVPAVNGNFAVYGVVGDTQVTVTKDGYVETGKRLVVSQHERIDIDLPLVRPRLQLAAHYTLTVTAADGCTLPSELRQRSYSAKIEQIGSGLIVTLLQAPLVRNVFGGRVEANDVSFTVSSASFYSYYYYYLPAVLEFVGSRYYTFDGKVVARVDGTSITGTMDGGIGEMTAPPYRYGQRCMSDRHTFRMAR